MYHDERIFREDDRGHTETTQVSIPKDVSCTHTFLKLFHIKFQKGEIKTLMRPFFPFSSFQTCNFLVLCFSWLVRLSARAEHGSVKSAATLEPVSPLMSLARVLLNGSSPFPARRIRYGRRNICCNRGASFFIVCVSVTSSYYVVYEPSSGTLL